METVSIMKHSGMLGSATKGIGENFYCRKFEHIQNATDEDKIEAMSMIYEHMMEHLEHHLEGDALPFFYSLHRVGGTVFWPAFYQRVMQAFDETFISY